MRSNKVDDSSLDPIFDIQPIERAETLPSRCYTDPFFYELDNQVLFEQSWHFVGHVSQVNVPGEYILATIGKESIIIIRDQEGEIRAFYNVCRHRGGPLVLDSAGCVNMLQCKYHGWTYKIDGSLRGVPRFNRVELFDRSENGLKSPQIGQWEGLLFVNLSDEAGHLEKMLTGIREQIAPINLRDMKFERRVSYVVACNWKVYVDNYLEGYHLPYVHPELCNALELSAYTTELHASYSLQHSPITSDENVYTKGGGTAYYYHVFPNFMLNILPGRLQTNVILPLSLDKTIIHFDYYYSEIGSKEALEHIERDISFSDKVQQEDVLICEFVQKGIQSRSYDKGRFSAECEQGVYHFQVLLKKAYQAILAKS